MPNLRRESEGHIHAFKLSTRHDIIEILLKVALDTINYQFVKGEYKMGHLPSDAVYHLIFNRVFDTNFTPYRVGLGNLRLLM